MPYTVKEILKRLHADGWEEVPNRTKGSHIQLKHPTKPGKVTGTPKTHCIRFGEPLFTVPNHSGDIPAGTLGSILKQAGLK